MDDLPPLRDVIAAHDLNPKKSLGQNFLLDQNVTDKISHLAFAGYAGALEDLTVFEIGPGPGGLTRSLLRHPVKQVVAVEFDPRAVAALQGLKDVYGDRVQILHADALKTDLMSLSSGPRAIVANLPYNVATPLLIGWLKQIKEHNAYEFMALMFQREVANRIAAGAGNKAYGRLSILSQWLCQCSRVYDLPASAFTPPPKVDSAVVKFVPKKLSEKVPDFHAVEQLTSQAFGQRRKMIRSSLKAYMDQIEELNIDPTKRAEDLSVEEFIALASI